MKQGTILFFLLFIGFAATAQEVISPLSSNPVLIEQYAKRPSNYSNARMASVAPLALPFIDDFSKPGPWPDTSKWIDDNVYVNATFPKAPPTIGVATFDGLKNNGLPYDWAVQNNSSKKADTLVSKPIDLSGAISNVYFTFFYQAQGRGNAPEPGDSLILEFRTNDTVWVRVWSAAGYTLPTTDSTFNFVSIQIDSAAYLYSGFQFKFWNKATLSGNVDHWHIDYVYLDKNRTNPTAQFPDVALVYPTGTFLKNYRAIPWNQFVASDTLSVVYHPVRNNDIASPNTVNYIKLYDESGVLQCPPVTAISAGNIEPYATSGYSMCTTGCPGMKYTPFGCTFNVTDSTVFDVVDSIAVTSGTDLIQTNNVYHTQQVFGNYFAYDDGSAELAYGLSSAFAQLAYKFTLTTPDTLRGVAIFWNPFLSNASGHGMRVTVWNDANGVPGQVIYQDSVKYPAYQPGPNGFTFYPVDDTLLRLNGIVYVGFIQIDPETLNVGLDMNSNAQSKIFYNTQGSWNNTIYKGALMIRPFFGPESLLAEVPEVSRPASMYSVYPNPAQDRLYIKRKSNAGDTRLKLSVFDAYGRTVSQLQQNDDSSLDVSTLAAGIYFIRIENAEGAISTERFIIAR